MAAARSSSRKGRASGGGGGGGGEGSLNSTRLAPPSIRQQQGHASLLRNATIAEFLEDYPREEWPDVLEVSQCGWIDRLLVCPFHVQWIDPLNQPTKYRTSSSSGCAACTRMSPQDTCTGSRTLSMLRSAPVVKWR